MPDARTTATTPRFQHQPAEVIDSRRISPTAHWIRVARPEGFSFTAGQYVDLEVATEDGVESHYYSIACAPTRRGLEFATRLRNSPFKDAFQDLRAGDTVAVSKPSGDFVLDASRPAVFLSGGIGITPIKAILEDVIDRNIDQQVVLLYGNEDEEEMLFRNELDGIARRDNVKVVHTLHDPTPSWQGARGFIGAALIEEHAGPLRGPIYYICGPPGMVRAMRKTLREVAPDAPVKAEDFAGYP